ncbi:MAG: subclass B1 metallo-beta-lactamase [Candidatus Marinimicrobia bacterium]|nr:subclass B1 metallo-beta-lactamase [Candidatus Neomarinimicrobiota bacterium]MCF7828713.1 subclass B1 metallo-beta-lactamase [Candidatus Neomarinimicrobiota bacterium]MCF7880454.1 subclass B1 metallo-beta-lactamase [Candidatus Neomarinimicrobiota bacterium]
MRKIGSGLIIFVFLFGHQDIKGQQPQTIRITEDVQLVHLRDSVFVHVTYHSNDEFGRFPSNGLLVISNGEAVMVDTPMDIDKTRIIVEYLEDSLDVQVTEFIAGHYHADCIGGLEFLQNRGVESIANTMTVDICRARGLPVPSRVFTDSLTFHFNGDPIECWYFGGGHSRDNITVWLPEQRILFGGCLIRAAGARGLGNTAEAVVDEWDATVDRILDVYRDIRFVIPGHGDYGGTELLNHTIDLVRTAKGE